MGVIPRLALGKMVASPLRLGGIAGLRSLVDSNNRFRECELVRRRQATRKQA